MFPVAFPYQHPSIHSCRADPSMFLYPHDSNLGNTEFEQGALDRLAGAEGRTHLQRPSPVANAGRPVACYPLPLSLSGQEAAIVNNREISCSSAPQTERSGCDAASKSYTYSSEAERAFYADGEAELDHMMQRWEMDDAKYDPECHWRNYIPRVIEPKLVLPDQIDLFGSLHGMTYDPKNKVYIGDGYPRPIPTRLDGSGPCTEDPLTSAERATSQAMNSATGPITDILHVQTDAHVRKGMKDFGTEPDRPVTRLRLCLCDMKWYSASLMAQAEHICVDSTVNAERQVDRRIMWDDLVRQGLVPGQPTIDQTLEGGSEDTTVGLRPGKDAGGVDGNIAGATVKSKDSAVENESKGIKVRDFAIKVERKS